MCVREREKERERERERERMFPCAKQMFSRRCSMLLLETQKSFNLFRLFSNVVWRHFLNQTALFLGFFYQINKN